MPKRNFTTLKIIVAILFLILFLIIGGTYTFLSQESLITMNLDFGLSNFWLKVIGISSLIAGVGLFFASLFTDFVLKVDRLGSKYWYFFWIWDIAKLILIVILGYLVLSGGVKVAQSVI